MSNEVSGSRLLTRVLIAVFGAGLLIHVLTVMLSDSALALLRWQNLAVHASVEAAGAMIALMAAYLLLRLDKANEGCSFNQRIAAALIAMGVLDGLHALTPAGQTFVWLHSCATFLGGTLFALVWLPHRWFASVTLRWPIWAFVFAGVLGASSLLWPEHLPILLANGRFTFFFVAMNVMGGALMLTAAARIAHRYFRSKKTEDLLFCLQCVLFAFGALVYEKSTLWNATWWGSHLLRLMAYAVTLWLLVRVAASVEDQTRQALRVLELEASNLRLKLLSTTDGLTGIANRRCFDETLLVEWSRALRTQQPLALGLMDVDMFKKYNDGYGHQSGDECLRQVAKTLSACVRRSGELAARYGGEEFVFLAPATDVEQAVHIAESIREQLEQQALPHEYSPFGHVTVSIGVCCLVASNEHSAEILIRRADEALYSAKAQGRNRVVLAGISTD